MALAVFPWQKHLADTLNGMRGKLPNGLLIYGPRGIGTFELVHAFAKSLMCTSPAADGTPCGHCKGCHLTASYAHPDLVYVVSEAEALPRDIPFEEPDNATAKPSTAKFSFTRRGGLRKSSASKQTKGACAWCLCTPRIS